MNDSTIEQPKWLNLLDDSHALLTVSTLLLESVVRPPIDLVPVASGLQRAFGALYGAFAFTSDPLLLVEEADRELAGAIALLEPAAESPHLRALASDLGVVRRVLDKAREPLSRLQWRPPGELPELRASEQEPRLHMLERPPLPPKLVTVAPEVAEVATVPAPVPPPQTFEELAQRVAELRQRAEERESKKQESNREEQDEESPAASEPAIPQGFAADPLPALTEVQLLQARARYAFDEVAMIGMHRTPLLGDQWRAMFVFEQRMITNIDAFAALGPPAFAALEELGRLAPIKDPNRLFATTMIAGSLEGRDSLAIAERFFLQEELSDPAYGQAFGSALALVPHPWVAPVARRLLSDPAAARRALGLRVLVRRGVALEQELHAGAFDEPSVVIVALPELARSQHADLPEALERAMRLCNDRPDDAELFLATSSALCTAGHSSARAFIGARIGGPVDSQALLQQALYSRFDDATSIVEMLSEQPRPAVAIAAGWVGAPEGVPALIGLLASKDEELKVAAAYALERLTAAGFIEEAALAPEHTEDIDLPEPDLGDEPERPASLARRVSHPLDEPSDGSPDIIVRPCTDPAVWNYFWRENAPRFPNGKRCRRGQLYSPHVSLQELDTGSYLLRERRALQRELTWRTGQHVPFDPEDWVAVQARSIEAWTPIVQRASYEPGGWGLRKHRPA